MRGQLNEAELEVDSEKASYKQRLEVLQQQEELIEDEEEQEQKEEDARRARREASERTKREEEARVAESLLPDSEVRFMYFLLRRGLADESSMAAAF
jgi:LETM1 and EF-hand domain-containing protein 1